MFNEKSTGLPDNNLQKKIDDESTVVKNILSGKFSIEFISESLDSDEYKYSGNLANRYNYELIVPSPDNEEKDWKTHISIYYPMKKNEIFEKVPDFKIKILTGQGELDLTSDVKIKEMVFKKIAEQINIKNDIKNEYIPSRHFSFDGFLEMIEFLENNPGADRIPRTLWVSRKEEIIINDKYWILMGETLKNFQKTLYRDGGGKEFDALLTRVKKINPDFNFIY